MQRRHLLETRTLTAAVLAALATIGQAYAADESSDVTLAPADATLAAPLAAAPTPTQLAIERGYSANVFQVKADAAHNLGFTGRGVTVAVIDTGVRATHMDLTGRVLAGTDVTGASGNRSGQVDIYGHGTMVSGIIAGAKNGAGNYGIAYEAKILPVQVFSRIGGSVGAYDSAVAAGIAFATGRSAIANLSLGGASQQPATALALQNGVKAGMLYTIAAGNSGGANPMWPARYAKETWANGQIMAVGAVDSRNVITSYSNRAGDAANFFLVAPGTAVASYYSADNVWAQGSGTSFAAPLVAGAAALVKQRWSYLSAQQIASTLFRTADDLGAKGVDNVYGWGLLNVSRAMNPIGVVGITFQGGRVVSAAKPGTVITSSATGSGTAMAVKGLSVSGVDEIGRDFDVNVAGGVSRVAPLSIAQMFGTADRMMAYAERVTDKLGSRSLVAVDQATDMANRLGAFAAYDNRARSGDSALIGAASVRKFADGTEMAFGAGGMNLFFGLAGTTLEGAPSLNLPAFSNAYMSLVPSASSLGYAMPLGGAKLKVGVASSALSNATLGQYGLDLGERQSNLATAELHRTIGTDLALGLGFASVSESGAHLGSAGTGAFALNGTARTQTYSLNAAYKLADGLALAGYYTMGFTNGMSGDALIQNVSTVRSDAFGLGLVKSETLRMGDRLSFSVSQPLRATSGSMTLGAPSGMSSEGVMQYTTTQSSLAASGRERLTELNYTTPVGRTQSVGLTAMLRHNPGNDATLATERAIGVRFQQSF